MNWDKTLQNSLTFSYCRKSIRKQIRPSCRKNILTSFCICLVSWKQRNVEIRANIRKSCRRPVVSLLYATKSALGDLGLYCSEFMSGMRTCLPCHIPDRWSRNANRIWPDLAFGFVHKRFGNKINGTSGLLVISNVKVLDPGQTPCFTWIKPNDFLGWLR